MLPNIYMYCCSYCCHISIVVSLSLSSISSRSHFLGTTGLKYVCVYDLCFFCCPIAYSFPHFFKVKGVLCSSPLPPSCHESCYSFVCWEADSSTSSMFGNSFLDYYFSTCSFSTCSFSTTTLAVSYFLFCSTIAHATF